MPSYKPKTRFVVDFAGVPRELFAVRQRSNGDLVILTKSALNHEEADGSNNPILVDRTSVHVSRRSSGTTIKQTFELQNRKKVENAALIRDSKDNLLWLIRAFRSADLRNERYVTEIHQKDTVFSMPSFDAEIQCVSYSISVFKQGTTLPDVSAMYSSIVADFKVFSLIVHFMYLPVPSLPHGDSLFVATSTPRITTYDGPSYQIPLGSTSKTETELAQLLIELFANLGERLLVRIERDFPQYAVTGYFDVRCRAGSAMPYEDFEDLKSKLAQGVLLALPADKRPNSFYLGGL